MRGLLGALVLAPLLAAPSVLAAPFEGRLWFGDAPVVEGSLVVAAEGGLLDLTAAHKSGVFPTFAFARAEGWILDETYQRVDVGSNEAHYPEGLDFSPPGDRVVAGGPGWIRVVRCASNCTAVLLPEGGRVGLAGNASGAWALRPSEETLPLDVGDGRLALELPDKAGRWAQVEAGPGSAMERATPMASGRVRLYLFGGDVLLANASGSETVRTGEWSDAEEPSSPFFARIRTTQRVLVLTLEDVRVDAPGPLPARLAAPRVEASLAGTLASTRADGVVESRGATHPVRGEAVALSGDVAWSASAAPVADGPAARPSDAAAPRLAGPLRGDGAVRIGGAEVVAGGAAPPSAALLAGGAALLLAAALAAVALFSRIRPGEALLHPARKAAYEHVRANPGQHVAEISRVLGMTRVVLQYHLGILERHRLIAHRRAGRQRVYVPAEQRGEDWTLLATLRSDASRRVMEALRARPGATQRDLVGVLGMSQRLVSYHLARLAAAGLVRVASGKPQCYHPEEPVKA